MNGGKYILLLYVVIIEIFIIFQIEQYEVSFKQMLFHTMLTQPEYQMGDYSVDWRY